MTIIHDLSYPELYRSHGIMLITLLTLLIDAAKYPLQRHRRLILRAYQRRSTSITTTQKVRWFVLWQEVKHLGYHVIIKVKPVRLCYHYEIFFSYVKIITSSWVNWCVFWRRDLIRAAYGLCPGVKHIIVSTNSANVVNIYDRADSRLVSSQ